MYNVEVLLAYGSNDSISGEKFSPEE